MKLSSKKRQQGFTLVELAIVLVIIGLIVGGVLAGQDLIKAATIRAQSTQLSQYDTGALTFQNKYNGLPGDLLHATAVTNFSVATITNAVGAGDGNGLVEGTTAAGAIKTDGIALGGETAVFWYQLQRAGLITDNITNNNPGAYSLVPSSALPNAKIGGGSQIMTQAISGLNYFVLGGLGGVTAVATGIPTTKGGMSPLTATQLDGKLDDGNPRTGKVVAVVATAVVPGTAEATTATTGCQNSSLGYNTGPAYGEVATLCSLSIRSSF